jgi:hypothetical protein
LEGKENLDILKKIKILEENENVDTLNSMELEFKILEEKEKVDVLKNICTIRNKIASELTICWVWRL